MPKLTIPDRVLAYYQTALDGVKANRGCRGKRNNSKQDRLYSAMLGVCGDYGITVLRVLNKEQLSKEKRYTMPRHWAGLWDARRSEIVLDSQALDVFAHELAHAFDWMLNGTSLPASCELVACAVASMICRKYSGLRTHNVQYAKEKGATAQLVEQQKDRIMKVYEEMCREIDTKWK